MNVLIIILMVVGVFFFGVGTIGFWRFPDVFSRAHATTKCDTLGAGLILLALALQQGLSLDSVKLMIIVLLVWVTNATAAHIIGRSAYRKDYPMTPGSVRWTYKGKGGKG